MNAPADALLTVHWRVNGGDWQNAAASATIFLVAEGSHSIEAYAQTSVPPFNVVSATIQRVYTISNAGIVLRDSNTDGMPDVVEVALGLNSLDVNSLHDSDGDGVGDFDEALRGADANDPQSLPTDTDGDGWSDFDEVARGTNPNDSAAISNPRPLRFPQKTVLFFDTLLFHGALADLNDQSFAHWDLGSEA
ncbi:MAG: hypothetical protein GY703_24445, partial [Gammaproteobacteria bacterium]|nr:hypothetical protein [Gammaproteobacteria bacterium]